MSILGGADNAFRIRCGGHGVEVGSPQSLYERRSDGLMG